MKNPYDVTTQKDQYEIWEGLVKRDVEAFVKADWEHTAVDFCAERFLAIHAHQSLDPDQWTLHYSDLDSYRLDWLRQRAEFEKDYQATHLAEDLYNAIDLWHIDIQGSNAIVHKKFAGEIRLADATQIIPLQWQTIYKFQKINNKWLIVGFIGYLPYKK